MILAKKTCNVFLTSVKSAELAITFVAKNLRYRPDIWVGVYPPPDREWRNFSNIFDLEKRQPNC